MFSASTETDPEPKSLGNIEANDLNSNQQIVPVAYLAGRRFIAGQSLTDVYNVTTKAVQSQTTKGGKGGSAGATYIDYGTFGLAFCMGGRKPVEAVFRIVVNTDIVWESVDGVWFGGAEYVDITVENWGTVRIYKGSFTQGIDPRLVPRGPIPDPIANPDFDRRRLNTWPNRLPIGGETSYLGLPSGETNAIAGHYDPHSAYRPVCYGLFINWKLGRNPAPAPNIKVELQRSVPWLPGSTADRAALALDSTDAGVNAIGVIYDVITDPIFGFARADADLYQAGWETALIACAWLRIAPLVTNFMAVKALLGTLISPWSSDVKSYVDGFLRERDGLLDIGVFTHGAFDLNQLPLLTDDDLDDEPDLQPDDEIAGTTFFVSYSDKDHFYQRRPQKHDDPSARAQLGEERDVIDERDWITDGAVAKRWVVEAGHIRTLPGESGPIPVKREWLDNAPKVGGGSYGQVREGDRFLWNSASKGLSQLLWIFETEWPEDRSGQTTLHVENERGYFPTPYYPPPDTSLGDFVIEPVDLATRRVVELPLGQLKTSPNNQVAILALRTDVAMRGFHVHTSVDNTSFVLASERNHFAVFGKVKSTAYVDSTDVVDVSVGMVVDLYGPDLDGLTPQSDQARDDNTWLCFCGAEIMSVGDIEALGDGRYRIYFLRAVYDTRPATHAVDADVWFIPRANITSIENANFLSGSTRYFKLQPYTIDQELDLADATSFAYSFASLPPGLLAPFGLKVSRLYKDTGTIPNEAHVVFSWDWGLTQDVAGFDIAWRAGATQAAFLDPWNYSNIAQAGVTIYDSQSVAQVKRQSLDLMVGASNLNYAIRVRAIDSAGFPSDWSLPLSRQVYSSTTSEPSAFKHFKSKAELEAYDVTGINVGDIVFVTVNGTTQMRQLATGAPSGATQWAVLNQPSSHWAKTL
jgi:hypothetical protein